MNIPRRYKQILSIFLTLGIYTWVWNWKLALVIVLAVSFHECCHLLAAHYYKLKTDFFYLVPFVGGGALISPYFNTEFEKAKIVLAGPYGGGLSALICWTVYYFTKSPTWSAIAGLIALFNLFNLLPISMLDGGQLFRSLMYSINRTAGMVFLIISTIAGVIALFFISKVLCGLALGLGLLEVISEIINWRNYRNGDYHLCTELYLHQPTPMNKWEGLEAFTAYLLLIVGLVDLIRHVPFTSLDLLK